jgi:hypothetical protein
MYQRLFTLTLLLLPAFALAAAPGSVPIIYTTDLLHPHSDPDDHYDLATLFAIPKFDIQAIIIDLGEDGKGRAAVGALRQIMHLTGREVPWAEGLVGNLASADDTALDREPGEQAGIRLLLDTLRKAEKPVTIMVTGSLRDIAAAYNREPALFTEKVARIYVNAGSLNQQVEWNVALDLHAYLRVMRSELPIYWAPCFGDGGHETWWKFTQADVLENLPATLQQFFLYMLEKIPSGDAEPVEFLQTPPLDAAKARHWPEPRNMWCTAPLLHAACQPMPHATFDPRTVIFHDDGIARIAKEGEKGALIHTFHQTDATAYAAAMPDTLRDLLQRMKAQ